MASSLSRRLADVRPTSKTSTKTGLSWLDRAIGYIGTREIRGRKHNRLVLRWASIFGIRDDETPWCGSFVAGMMKEDGRPVQKRGAAARSWLKYGKKLDKPAVGCIVVFWRGKRNGWSGHVGFVVGKDQYGNLMVLGGNQGNAVNIKPFSTKRVLGYRWPSIWPSQKRFKLPVVNSNGRVSNNEA